MVQAQANAKTAFAECDAKYPAGTPDSVKYAAARNACNAEAARPLRQFTNYPDLFDRYWAHRALIAEKLQAGKLTVAEANVQATDFQSQLASEEQQRNLANRAVGAQETVANAAWRSTLPKTCTAGTNSVTCF
jgi:hypothetical protein